MGNVTGSVVLASNDGVEATVVSGGAGVDTLDPSMVHVINPSGQLRLLSEGMIARQKVVVAFTCFRHRGHLSMVVWQNSFAIGR
jgi:hypothetical protein